MSGEDVEVLVLMVKGCMDGGEGGVALGSEKGKGRVRGTGNRGCCCSLEEESGERRAEMGGGRPT